MKSMKMFLSKLWNSAIAKTTSVQSLIAAIRELSESLRLLISSLKNMHKMQMEDRAAIEELYLMYGDILSNIPAKQLSPAVPPPPKPKTTPTPIEQIQQEKKKNSLN